MNQRISIAKLEKIIAGSIKQLLKLGTKYKILSKYTKKRSLWCMKP